MLKIKMNVLYCLGHLITSASASDVGEVMFFGSVCLLSVSKSNKLISLKLYVMIAPTSGKN